MSIRNILFVLCIFCNQSYSQHGDSTVSVVDYIYLADSLANINLYDLAADNYNLALLDKSQKDWGSWYNTFGKYRSNRYKGQHDLRIVNEISVLLNEIEIDEFEVKGKMLFYLGYYNSNLGYVKAAIIEYKQAIELFNKVQNPDSNTSKFILSTYQNIAINYSRLGDNKSAIKFIRNAFNVANRIKDESNLCDLYLIYSKFLFYEDNYYELKEILQEVNRSCSSNFIKSYALDYLAEVYILQDSIVLARQCLEKSYEINRNKQYQYYEIKGEYYKKTGNFSEAKNQYTIALNQLRANVSKRSYRKSLVKYAEFLYSLNEKEKSIIYSHKALRNYYKGLDSLNVKDRSSIDEELPDIWIIEAFYIKAKYFKERYIETKNDFALGEAVFYFKLILKHLDELKNNYYSASSKYRMGIHSQKLYSEAMSFFIDQFSNCNKMEYFEDAFLLAQKANSFVLKNAIYDRKVLEVANVSKDSIDKYLLLSSKVAFEGDIDSKSGAQILFEFDDYKKSLISNYTLSFNNENLNEISIKEVQATLDTNSLLVKYHYFNDILFVFGISKKMVFAENIAFTKEMELMINSNMEILSQNECNDSIANIYLVNSKKVYDLILGNFIEKYEIEDIDHIIFIANGPIKKIAFNALAMNSSRNWNNPKTYLVSKYSVSYLYYSSQLKNKKKPINKTNRFIGYGIQYEEELLEEIISEYLINRKNKKERPSSVSLGSLTYADDEVLATARICNGTSYTNSDVTPYKVFNTIDDFNVIHFSTHAFVDETDYLQSFLVLNRDESNNYKLKYSDILNLNINSEMVVLSACHTSSGKNVIGEGLMSLSRAFFQSGSNSVVGSYWNTPDYTTKELMTLFYMNLKNGMTKSKALQKAQIEFLTNDKLSSPAIRTPFFWASWAIYGSNQPLEMEDSVLDSTFLAYFLSLPIIAVLIFFLTKLYLDNRFLPTD